MTETDRNYILQSYETHEMQYFNFVLHVNIKNLREILFQRYI